MSITISASNVSKEKYQQFDFTGLRSLELRTKKAVDRQLGFVVVDNGKVAVIPLYEIRVIVAKKNTANKEAMFLKEGVVYLDLANERPLQQLKGKYVFRLSPHQGDRSYMSSCVKIIDVSSIGEILYTDDDHFFQHKRRFLPASWNDGQWGPVTPAINGRAFFENICTVVDPLLQKQALSLVEKIFNGLGEDSHLSDKKPFSSLKEYCLKRKKEDLLFAIDALEKLIGSLSVTILSKKSPQDSNGIFRSKL